MRFTVKFIIYLPFIVLFLGCKKGEQDPGISLLSRKTRITGKWKLAAGSATYTYYNYMGMYAFDGNMQTYSEPGSGSVKSLYKLDLHISKNGTFNFTELNHSHELVASGTWYFNSGVGESKAKEEITFSIDKVTGGYTFDYFIFNLDKTNFTYKIKRLANKEMILFATDKLASFEQGDDITVAAEYKFIQE